MVSLGMWIASMLPVSEQSMGAPPGSFINKYTLRKARRARGVTGRQPPLPQRQGGHQNVARRPLALCQGSPTTHTYIPTLHQPQDPGFNAPPKGATRGDFWYDLFRLAVYVFCSPRYDSRGKC